MDSDTTSISLYQPQTYTMTESQLNELKHVSPFTYRFHNTDIEKKQYNPRNPGKSTLNPANPQCNQSRTFGGSVTGLHRSQSNPQLHSPTQKRKREELSVEAQGVGVAFANGRFCLPSARLRELNILKCSPVRNNGGHIGVGWRKGQVESNPVCCVSLLKFSTVYSHY